jgi:galacturonokinase
MGNRENLVQEMVARFGVEAESVRLVRSPYRVCPLGAHIDHQGGTVTAMAIDQAVWLAYTRLDSPTVRLQSRNFPGEVRFDMHAVP